MEGGPVPQERAEPPEGGFGEWVPRRPSLVGPCFSLHTVDGSQ